MKHFQAPFYSQITKLVLPIVLQSLLSSAVNSADVVMLGYVGQSAISAVSLASQYAHMLFIAFNGLGTGVTILCAQYFGKGEYRAIEVIQGIALRVSLLISLALAICAAVPRHMMALFTSDNELIAIGGEYIRILSVCYLCWGVTEIYIAILRSTGRVAMGTVLNTIAVAVNILLNAVFIFGWLGLPKMGVTGVALATVISRMLELVLCVLVSARASFGSLKPSILFLQNKLLFRNFVRLSLPAMANAAVFGLAFSTFTAIIGHMGSDAVAANSLGNILQTFGNILSFGFASAGGILLGQKIGEGKLEEAKADGSRLLRLTVAAGIFGGLVILLARPFVLAWAENGGFTDTALHCLSVMLIINSYHVVGAAVSNLLIAGMFRAGGDSRFGLICDIFVMWCYAVPLALLSAFVLRLPVLWVYFLFCTDEFAKWPWIIHRYRSGKWVKDITREGLFESDG